MLPRVALFVVASALLGVDGFGYMAPCMHADGHDCMNEAGCYWDNTPAGMMGGCIEDSCRSRPRAREAPCGAHIVFHPPFSPQASTYTTKRRARRMCTQLLMRQARTTSPAPARGAA